MLCVQTGMYSTMKCKQNSHKHVTKMNVESKSHQQTYIDEMLQNEEFKNFNAHFISALEGVEDNFPIHQWDELVHHTNLILNLLWQSNMSQNKAAFAYHHGPCDYNRIPIAPLCCAVQFHNKLTRCRTWGKCQVKAVTLVHHLKLSDATSFLPKQHQ